MGFGYLFIGYMFTFSFTYRGFDVLPDLIGFIIAYIGLISLSEYGCGWDTLKKFFHVLIPASAVTLVFQILGLYGKPASVAGLWYYAYTAFLMLYNILLLVAIFKIAQDTESKSIAFKARRNLTLGIVYYVLTLFLSLPFSPIQKLSMLLSEKIAFGLFMYVFGYIVLHHHQLLFFYAKSPYIHAKMQYHYPNCFPIFLV